ncbi:MAG: RNA methyltransferase [Simkaniaceae bacterium]|nr:RNA methyltransferase [Simkaniaceae bacterium]
MVNRDCIKIESVQNPKIKLIVKLKDKRDRDKTGLFFIEGYRESLRAFEGHVDIDMIFCCPALFLKDNEWALIRNIQMKGAEIFEVSKEVFQKISMRDRPDGMALIAKQKRLGCVELERLLETTKTPFLCVAESIEKPGNLGAILRSCDAAGVDGLVVCNECTDVFNPNVVRASVGTLFTVPIFQMTTQEAIELFKRYRVKVVATTPSATQLYTAVDYRSGLAIAMGTEQVGLTEVWFDRAFEQVYIPMKGHADSLNVANATTLLLYEVLRQRSS